MTLFSMVAEVADKIKNLEEKETLVALAEHNLSVNPEGCEKLAEEYRNEAKKKSPGTNVTESDATPENTAKLIAVYQYTYLKTIPGLSERIMNVIDQRSADPATRVALLGALIYFVKPKDVMPDNMPGGVGFLDDGVVIYSMADEFFSILKPKKITAGDINAARYAFSFGIAPDLKSAVESQIEQMWKSFHLLKTTPAQMVEMILQQLITNPHALQSILSQDVYQNAGIPTMPQGTSFPQFPSGGMYSAYPAGTTFSTTPGGGSIMTEGNNMSVSFGGGGGAAMVGGDIVCWD
jgi:uncharacterized membrane protein YkvA (DUF1232 family)